MTTYNTYQEAKIANPEEVIFKMEDGSIRTQSWINANNFGSQMFSCMNPADYCMTLGDLRDKHGGEVGGDIMLGYGSGDVRIITHQKAKDRSFDRENLILRAAALEEKKPRTKVEYAKCNFECAWHAVKAFEDGERLYTKRSHKDYILIDSAPDVLRFLYDLHECTETTITEREEFVEALQELWIIDGVDGQEQMDKIFDSGKFKLVN